MPERVAGVLLAAGDGTRLGQPKALVELGGQSLAARGVALLRDGGADPVVLVTGAAPVDLPGIRVVPNPRWQEGMGSSFAAGLAALPARCAAAVVALADQPLVGAESVRRLIAAFRAGAGVAVAAYSGRPRNPVLLARAHWPQAIALAAGDVGARRSCARIPSWSRWWSAATPAVPTISTRQPISSGSPGCWAAT